MDNITFEIMPEEAGERLDKLLANKLPDLSRMQIQHLIRENLVLVNQASAKPSHKLTVADELVIQLPEQEALNELVPAQPMPLDIIYEDEHIVAVHKPAGLVVHPAVGSEDGTLVNALLARYPQIAEVGERERAGIVHRLDKFTSGIMLAALTQTAQLHLIEQFAARAIHKVYWGLVEQRPQTPTGHIEAPIGRNPRNRKLMTILTKGRPAKSDYYTLKEYENHTLLELRPITGRTHQLRVHLKFIGCPIVGDIVYGFRKPTIKMDRMFLHARTIAFQHPITGEPMTLSADLPPELQNILDMLDQQYTNL